MASSGGDFLSENNRCGQTILRLVSRGQALIAELLRLSVNIPPAFRLANEPGVDQKYAPVIFDFRYRKSGEYFENKIENSAELMELDAEMKENHVEILRRFYQLFEAIYKYGQDFNKYVEDLESGLFIQHTLEDVLMNPDGGKQLMSEAVYLYGVILLLLDARIEGEVRERMLVSHLRYRGQMEYPLIDEVMNLCRSTGLSTLANKRPANYPEDYFARWNVSSVVIRMIIGRLRTDDIYNQIQCYPLPEHRSAALATQACMLYVILYFAPDILKNEQATMREIVDKHFADNWVITYYLGYVVDLSVVWEPYKAAKLALANTIGPDNVRGMHQRMLRAVDTSSAQLRQFLNEGVLTEDYVMDSTSKLMAGLREANVTLRWLMLHTNAQQKKMREQMLMGFDADKLLMLLLLTAQFEFVLKGIFQALLDAKQAKWEKCRKEAEERMKELGDYFSGERPLTRVKKNENLQKWFHDISGKVASIDYQDSTQAGRKIQQLIQALEGVEQFQEVEDNLQVKQFLADTRGYLNAMIRVVNIKDEHLVIISGVSDISYAFDILNNYVDLMQRRIKNDPSCVLLLRATFLKLASVLDLPLIRILQANSPDLVSVSEYYSTELVSYVRRVLEVIPKSMFTSLKEIIDLQTTRITDLPTKVEKDKLKDFAQLDERFQLARSTYAISVFTEGMLAMQTTLVGVIQVDPRQLLEDGIRKELVNTIASTMNHVLVFRVGSIEDFEKRLRECLQRLDGFRRSFQYIQDYVNIYALKVWQEEFSRIVNYYVEQECNTFLRKKVFDWQSAYQSRDIPIPNFGPDPETKGPRSVNCIGRLTRELLAQTDFRSSIYIDHMAAWYSKEGRELVGLRSFTLLLASVSVFGLRGIDQLLCFMIVKELQEFIRILRSQVDKSLNAFLKETNNELNPTDTIPKATANFYKNACGKVEKLQQLFLEVISKVGQMQLIRRQIANILNFSCKLDSNTLYCALEVMNNALLADVQAHYAAPETKPYPKDDNPVLSELSTYLETAGINDPFTKIYITTTPLESFSLLTFLLVVSIIPKLQYSSHLGVLMSKGVKKDNTDGTPFAVGIITLLKQFHSLHTQKFLGYMGQFVRGFLNVSLQKVEAKPVDLPTEVTNVLVLLEEFCKFSSVPRSTVEGYLPAFVFDHFKSK